MKFSLNIIKLFIVFLILQQIVCAAPAGMMLAHNITGSVALGIFNLGKGGTFTIQSLIGELLALGTYQKRLDAFGAPTGRKNHNSYSVQPFQQTTITLSSSAQDYFLYVEYKMPKLVMEVKDSAGQVIKSIDQNAYGTAQGAMRQLYIKSDCTFYFDLNYISAPDLKAAAPVYLLQYDKDGQLKSFITLSKTILAFKQLNLLAGQIISIGPDIQNYPIDIASFSFGFPIFSPVASVCQIEQAYLCAYEDTLPCRISNGYKCAGSNKITCTASCGDQVIDDGEQCDGGSGCGGDCKLLCGNLNLDNGEDCDGTADCGEDCKFLCGNGKLDNGEDCDNGNKQGCVACKIASGYECPLVDGKSACSAICKTNKILEEGEECDNGGKDGCTNCKIVSPYKCKNTLGKPSLCYICGNSIYQQGEECDNGNKTGCINCTLDRGFTCKNKIKTLSNCTNICGDGLWVEGEECDNGNQTGCINCLIAAKFTCRGPKYTTSKCISCGNFIVEWPQQCDNNNVNGCKNCIIQTGWNCRANPKYCYRIAQVCGNGEREIKEDCDDGNKVNGDGCSSQCKKETGYTCSDQLGEKTTCNKIT